MSNYDDIPEVFRRAMEEMGWEADEEGKEKKEQPPSSPRPPQRPPSFPRPTFRPFWANRRFWLVILGLVILFSLGSLIRAYTDWLWFRSLGYGQVWVTQWGVKTATLLLFTGIAAATLLLNWLVAFRRAGASASTGFNLLRLPGLRPLLIAAALFLAYLFGAAASSNWDHFLLYLNRVPFNITDPIFHRDISFYMFALPVFRFLQGWIMPLFFIAILGVTGLYALGNWTILQRGRWQPQVIPALRQHLALLFMFFVLAWAAGNLIDMADLVYSSRGVVRGVSYTDLHATLPALRWQTALSVLFALAIGYNIFRFDWRPLLLTGGLWLGVAIFGTNLYPSLLQRYAVEPNELDRESEFIDYNIEFTRLAFKLNDIQMIPFDPGNGITRQDVSDNAVALDNIRVWDYRPLQTTYNQLQSLRPYYQFGELDIDRYLVDGAISQVMLGARELDKSKLSSPTWVNLHLEYTHGYGIVMNPVNKITPDGQPAFYISNLPPQSTIPLEITRPEIYFGELMDDVVYVGSGLEEFDYPSGNANVYSQYGGTGGIELSNIFLRLLFAIRLGDTNLLLSDRITNETRVLLYREIRQMVGEISPYLRIDDDPYIVLAEGRLFWIMDAYTTSTHFPFATPLDNGLNYVRNSVKIVIDAYNGSITYYLADPDDPLIQAYNQIFPDLLLPLTEMPDYLQAHIRYPEDWFTWQAQQYAKYHMLDTRVFYNEEDLWQVPQLAAAANQNKVVMEPYYVVFSLPDEPKTEYLLIQPYTPKGKDNMIAWLAARNDPPHYGELIVYELPKQELIFGPIQVQARIDQTPEISEQFTLWNQSGSRVTRGNLIVIPINDSFLYVEPVYLQAETSALPELKRVIVASGSHIAMRETLAAALTALLEDEPIIVEAPVATPEPAATPTAEAEVIATPVTSVIDLETATMEELIAAADAHFTAAQTAQQNGDWATYGAELAQLELVLNRLVTLSESSAP
ncbi:MAG: UPF0182 family protein [Chloroflexi bacterium]|nr:UPF0182 family protein [Chloroflexota bacterium]MBP8057675.1 UPF0182 family protein [Chloroflexota bacterium]